MPSLITNPAFLGEARRRHWRWMKGQLELLKERHDAWCRQYLLE